MYSPKNPRGVLLYELCHWIRYTLGEWTLATPEGTVVEELGKRGMWLSRLLEVWTDIFGENHVHLFKIVQKIQAWLHNRTGI